MTRPRPRADARIPSTSEPEARAEPLTADAWLALLLACEDPDAAQCVFERIAALDPEEGLAVMGAVWNGIPREDIRRRGMEVFKSEGHAFAHGVLHLAVMDRSVMLQADAMRYLSAIAFREFASDLDGYLAWNERCAALRYAEVLRAGAAEFGARSAAATDDELPLLFARFDGLVIEMAECAGVDMRAALIEAGIGLALERLLEQAGDDPKRTAIRWGRRLGIESALLLRLQGWLAEPDVERRASALRWMGSLGSDEAFLVDHVLPIVGARGQHDPRVVGAAVQLLGRRGNSFAVDALLEILVDPGEGAARFMGASRALAEIGDPRAIPTMIAVIRADNSYASVYGVGYFGLRPLTGVPYEESHDGAFWVSWWSNNRARLPESVRGMSLPFVSFD